MLTYSEIEITLQLECSLTLEQLANSHLILYQLVSELFVNTWFDPDYPTTVKRITIES